MIHHRIGLMLSLVLALTLSACAMLSGAVSALGPAACEALVEVLFPGSDVIAARVCPEVARELAELLAERGNGGRGTRHEGRCDPLPADHVIAESPRGAYLCRGRLGGEQDARALYMLAHKRAAARRLAQDGGTP